jgi:hypothetical protein
VSVSYSFKSRLEEKVQQQLNRQNVGYLLGAGASYLDGEGYPLAGQLWERIVSLVRSPEKEEIQAKLDGGADGIEQALDLLDDGSVIEKPHRRLVTEAIAQYFLTLNPPTNHHQRFVRRLARRQELNISVFTLNYDGLVERAADIEGVRLVDGFLGVERSFFRPQVFQEVAGLTHRGARKLQVDWATGILHLYKLHGSLGWFQFAGNDVRRVGFDTPTSDESRRLMVPPQHRKATDTTAPPYAALWSDFRGKLCHGPQPLNRLVTIGYGFRDEHVNAIIENALARQNFSLLVFAHTLTPEVFDRWSPKPNVVLVSHSRCSLYGEVGPGHDSMWSFEDLSERV